MNKEQTDLVTALVQAEHPREYIKRELISQGLSTEGFEQDYQAILSDLHRTEPHAEQAASPDFLQVQQKAVRTHSHSHILTVLKWFFRTIVLVALCVLLLWGAMRFAPGFVPNATNALIHMGGGKSEDFSVSDAVVRSKVETTAVSMRLYGSRMGSFDGACKDVVIIAPIECIQNSRVYAVYAPLEDGQWYCMDSTGFKGDVESVSLESKSCK